MPKFIYKVKDDQGRVKTGTLDVANRKEAEQQLKAKGFVIQDLHPMPESKIGPGRVGQDPTSVPQRPINQSVVIPPLSLPNRSNPPSGKITSPAFLGRDPSAYEGPKLSLENAEFEPPKEHALEDEATQNWGSPPPSVGLPRPAAPARPQPAPPAPGSWPPSVGSVASGPAGDWPPRVGSEARPEWGNAAPGPAPPPTREAPPPRSRPQNEPPSGAIEMARPGLGGAPSPAAGEWPPRPSMGAPGRPPAEPPSGAIEMARPGSGGAPSPAAGEWPPRPSMGAPAPPPPAANQGMPRSAPPAPNLGADWGRPAEPPSGGTAPRPPLTPPGSNEWAPRPLTPDPGRAGLPPLGAPPPPNTGFGAPAPAFGASAFEPAGPGGPGGSFGAPPQPGGANTAQGFGAPPVPAFGASAFGPPANLGGPPPPAPGVNPGFAAPPAPNLNQGFGAATPPQPGFGSGNAFGTPPPAQDLSAGWPPRPGAEAEGGRGSDAPLPPRIDLNRMPPPGPTASDSGAFAPRIAPGTMPAPPGSKIDLGAPPPKLELEPLRPSDNRPMSAPLEQAPPVPAKLELNRSPFGENRAAPKAPLPPPEPEEPVGRWQDEPDEEAEQSPAPRLFRRDEEEDDGVDSWSRVLPPAPPLHERTRRKGDSGSFTSHLADDDELIRPVRRKKGFPVFGCFILFLFLVAATAGGAFYYAGHEIYEWLDVHQYAGYVPEWLKQHIP